MEMEFQKTGNLKGVVCYEVFAINDANYPVHLGTDFEIHHFLLVPLNNLTIINFYSIFVLQII